MTAPHVGTLGEKPLHASLKRWYAVGGDRVEHPVDGFVIDLVRDDLLIEIQTRGFSSLKRKLGALLDTHRVRVVHPIPERKWIVKVDDNGEVVSRRRSPKRGRVADVFGELVSIPELLAHPAFAVEVVLTEEEELLVFHGSKGRRRRGWVVLERQLLEVRSVHRFDTPASLAALLPDDLADEFTTADLAGAMGTRRRLAQQATYCLRNLDLLDIVGKEGNALVYRWRA